MTRTCAFVFDPDPEGGFVVTCPALPGLVTQGATLDEARANARDAMQGLFEVLLEDGETVPESDAVYAPPRLDELARTLREDGKPPIFELLTTQINAAA